MVSVNASGTGTANGNGDESAALSGYGIVIGGPVGQKISTSLNLTLSGALGNGSFANVQIVQTAPGGSVTDSGGLTNDGGISGNGILQGVTNSTANFTTSTLFVSAGDTVLVSLGLTLGAGCFKQGLSGSSVSCTSTADYLNTFGFSQTGPVFNLPAGWTANSADGSIVNNMYVAPEPSTLALVMLSLLGLAAARRSA
jgi:hypothetical protein